MTTRSQIKIFVISLAQDTYRQENIKKQFEGSNVPYEIFHAVDGRKLTPEEMNNVFDEKKAIKHGYTNYVPGLIGCSLSHKALYQKIVTENIERAIILEDDITIKPDFFLLLNHFTALPVKNYAVKLERCYGSVKDENNEKTGRFTPFHRIKFNDTYYIGQPFNDVYNTWGYYIDIKAAKSLLKIMPKIFLGPDEWKHFKNYIKLRMINKAVITTANIPPSIEYSQDRYTKKNKKPVYIRITNKIEKMFRIITLIFR